jgi:DNA repair protein RecN (Recombination protein N)
MLSYISVKNFAIIENIEVSFNEGMTSVTGETGAGKSLLIDAIGLLLGDRATSNVVRLGAKKAEVEGVFKYQNKRIDDILKELDIEVEDNEIIIKRQITQTNNNVIKINNTIVSLKDLRQVTSKLADIHTQLDTHRLINPQTYLDIIDGFHQEETERLVELYFYALSEYKKELKELKRIENSNHQLLEKLDLYRYQKKELESYNLDVEEESVLEKELEAMKNFDTIFQTLKTSIERIDSVSAIDVIYDSSKELENIASFDDDYKHIMDRFNSSYFELDDAFSELKSKMSELDFDPSILEEHESRLNSLDGLKRKYRKNIEELLLYLEQITKDINNIDNYDDVINEQIKKTEIAYKKVIKSSMLITSLRLETSTYIETELLKTLTDLELPHTNFKIVFNKQDQSDFRNSSIFLENGTDVVDFMLSTNVGEPIKSLSNSASGGEMSRIMLGFKNLLTKSLDLSLIIFDEIDTGVSGYVANQVAKKMLEIANDTQVICITHIPQVASISKNHLRIYKTVEDNRTKAHIDLLEGESRILEIAKMISGESVTNASLASAKELLCK